MKPVRFDDLRTFCRVDGWRCKADRPGRSVHKHEVWTKSLPDGEILRVVISKGSGEYTPRLASRILKHELRVTSADFWRAVRKGVPAERAAPKRERPEAQRLPLGVVRALLRAGYTEADLAGLSIDEAWRLLGQR